MKEDNNLILKGLLSFGAAIKVPPFCFYMRFPHSVAFLKSLLRFSQSIYCMLFEKALQCKKYAAGNGMWQLYFLNLLKMLR